MKHFPPANRPATLAIAAFLAFGSTHAFAQEATTAGTAPTIIVPPVVSPASPAPSAAPNFTASAPVVQATPSVEESKAAAIAASEAEASTPVQRSELRPAAQRSSAAPASTRPTRAVSADPAPVTTPVAPSAAERAPAAMQTERTATAMSPTAESASTPDVATQSTMSSGDQALYMALGGFALVLLGIGGAAAMRRRRRTGTVEAPVATYEPAADHRSVAGDHMPIAAEASYVPRAPASAFATSQPMTPAPRYGAVEAMVAAAPDRDNPFLTRSKRAKRARFLLAQRDAAKATMAHTPLVADQPATRPVDRSQTVYSFGKDGGRPAGGFLRPRTS